MASITYLPDGGGPDYGGAATVIRAFTPPLPSGGPTLAGAAPVSAVASYGQQPTLFGLTGSTPTILIPSGHSVDQFDCESACCCICTPCSGVGYWNSYSVTIPKPIGGLPSDLAPFPFNVINANTPFSRFVNINGPRSGSQGGNGDCLWDEPGFNVGNGTTGLVYLTVKLRATGVEVNYQFFVITTGLHLYSYTHFWTSSPSFSCRTGGTFAYTGGTAIDLIGNVPLPGGLDSDFTGTSVTVTAPVSGDPGWTPCGQNDDGTTYVPPIEFSPFAALQAAVGPRVKVHGAPPATRKALPLAHPDRCEHFTGPGHQAGCSGWGCLGKCDLGLLATPGGWCQKCPDYEPDPDYTGQGPPGWLK